jgi:hypothetical protein
MPCQSFRTSLVSLEFANQFFPQSYDFLVSNSVPLRPLHVSLSSPPCIRLDIYVNFFLQYRRYTLIRPRLTFVLPAFPSAIFNFYHLAFVNVPSYSVHITLILPNSVFNAPTHPPLLVSSPSPIVIVVVVSDGAGTAPGGGGPRGAYKCTCRGKPSMCTKRIQPEKGSKGCMKKGDRRDPD